MTIYDDLLASYEELLRQVRFFQEGVNSKASSVSVQALGNSIGQKAAQSDLAALSGTVETLLSTTAALQSELASTGTVADGVSSALTSEVTRAETAEAGLAKKDLSNPEAQTAIGSIVDEKVVAAIDNPSSTIAETLTGFVSTYTNTSDSKTFINPGGTTLKSTLAGGSGGSADGTNIVWWYGPSQTLSNNCYDLYSTTYLGADASTDTGGQVNGSVFTINPSKIQIVVHSHNGNKVRPTVASGVVVWWIGPSYPTNAASTDLWTAYHLPTQFTQAAAVNFDF